MVEEGKGAWVPRGDFGSEREIEVERGNEKVHVRKGGKRIREGSERTVGGELPEEEDVLFDNLFSNFRLSSLLPCRRHLFYYSFG